MSTIVEFRGSFRLQQDDGQRLRSTSKGTWYCHCGELASTEHNEPKCEVCQTGSRCGTDCTLSRVFCTSCGASN